MNNYQRLYKWIINVIERSTANIYYKMIPIDLVRYIDHISINDTSSEIVEQFILDNFFPRICTPEAFDVVKNHVKAKYRLKLYDKICEMLRDCHIDEEDFNNDENINPNFEDLSGDFCFTPRGKFGCEEISDGDLVIYNDHIEIAKDTGNIPFPFTGGEVLHEYPITMWRALYDGDKCMSVTVRREDIDSADINLNNIQTAVIQTGSFGDLTICNVPFYLNGFRFNIMSLYLVDDADEHDCILPYVTILAGIIPINRPPPRDVRIEFREDVKQALESLSFYAVSDSNCLEISGRSHYHFEELSSEETDPFVEVFHPALETLGIVLTRTLVIGDTDPYPP